jgi:hypothetical protein
MKFKMQDIKQTLTLQGFDLPIQNESPFPKKINYDYWSPEDTARDGFPITRQLAVTLVKDRYWDESLRRISTPENQMKFRQQPKAITFDRELLMLLLSQKGCEGVRCYFASNPSDASKEELTLVLVGVDKNKHDLSCADPGQNYQKKKSIIHTLNHLKEKNRLDIHNLEEDEDTIIIEVGGHDGMDDFE